MCTKYFKEVFIRIFALAPFKANNAPSGWTEGINNMPFTLLLTSPPLTDGKKSLNSDQCLKILPTWEDCVLLLQEFSCMLLSEIVDSP